MFFSLFLSALLLGLSFCCDICIAQAPLVAEWSTVANGSFNAPVFNQLANADNRHLAAVSSSSGFDSSNRVYLSDDGGLNWKIALSDRNINLDPNWMPLPGEWITRWYHAIARPTSNLILVMASDRPKDDESAEFFGSLYPYFLRSSDGGKTWDRVELSDDVKPSYFNTLVMNDANVGYAISNSPGKATANRQTIYRTNDAGLSWTPIELPESIKDFTHIQQVATSSLVLGSLTSLHFTTDAGQTWTTRDALNDVNTYNFKSTTVGYASGGKPTGNGNESTIEVHKTVNGGITWTPILDTLLGGSEGQTVDFWDDLNGIIISRSTILQTTNGGASWAQMVSPYEMITQPGIRLSLTSDSTGVAIFQNLIVSLTGRKILPSPNVQLSQIAGLSYSASWIAVEGTESYQLQLAKKVASGLIAYDLGIFETNSKTLDTILTATDIALPTFEYSRDYYMRVRALNGEATSAWSTQLIHRTNAKPDGTLTSPDLISPEHNAVVNSSQVTLKWRDDPHASHYSVKLTTQGTAPGSWADSIAQNIYNVMADSIVVGIEPDRMYAWYVIAHGDGQSPVASSAYRIFFTPTASVNKAYDTGPWLTVRSSIVIRDIEFTTNVSHVYLVSATGQRVREILTNSGDTLERVEDLPRGMYFLWAPGSKPVPILLQ